MHEREKERGKSGTLQEYIVHCVFALSSLHQTLSDPSCALCLYLDSNIIIQSRPHWKQTRTSHEGKSPFSKNKLKYYSFQCFELVFKASRQLVLDEETARSCENVKQQTALATRDTD